MPRPSLYAVLLRSRELSRCAEGLRCAVGLSLRSARVRVIFLDDATQHLSNPTLDKPIQLLSRLGHELFAPLNAPQHEEVDLLSEPELLALLLEADLSEAW